MVATIEYIESVIANYQAAIEANKRTPCREGNVVHITSEIADDVMVTADLHGHRKNFNAIKKIADLESHPRRHLIMQEVCHGGPTYPSQQGGCMSHGMLEDVAKMKAAYPERVHFLMSNHEMAELTEYPILKSNKMLNLMFRLGLQEMYGPATEKVREAYREFIRTCPLAARIGDDTFVCHSLPEKTDSQNFDSTIFTRELTPVDLQEHKDVFRLVWGRDFRQENAEAFAKKVNAKTLIHGHDPCPDGFRVPNNMQIILDCCTDKGCYILMPTKEPLSHQQIVELIKPLQS